MNAPFVRAASAALAFGLSVACHAETPASEVLVAGLNLQRMPSANGSSVTVDWVRSVEQRVVTAGADVSKVGRNQWMLFKASAAQNRGARPAVSGSVDIGPGSNDGERFTFLKLGLGLTAPLSEHWNFFARSAYVDVEPIAGHIVTVGGDTTRPNGVSFRLQTARSASGSLDERSHFVRFDYRARAPYIMAGITAASTNNRLSLGAVPIETAATKLRQAFFGLSFPVRGKDLTVAMDLGKVGGVRRSGVSIFVRSRIEPGD